MMDTARTSPPPPPGGEYQPEKALKVDLYLRVSTDRQAKEGDSLEEQESELKKFCEYRNYRIHKVYIERGKSGGNTNRPEYKKLVKDIEAGKINAVVVKKIDRLSRSILDFEALMTMLQEKNVEFISIKENFDTTSAMGKAMLRVALVFAQLEREQTSERLKDVFFYRASQGLYNGGIRPFGYTSVNAELVPYPKERETVELMAKQFLALRSTTAVAKFLNETGYRNRSGKLWDKREIQKILQNPVNTGKVKWNDQIFQGIHQPILSEKQFDDTQAIFQKKTYSDHRNRCSGVLKGLLRCGGCQSPMTPSYSLNKLKNKYYYYRCTSTQNSEKGRSRCPIKYVAFPVIESALQEALLSLSDENQFKLLENRILKHNESVKQDREIIKGEIDQVNLTLNQVKVKKEQYLDSLISNRFLSAERHRINSKLDELEQDEKQIKGKLYQLEFNYSQKEDEFIDSIGFKQDLITFISENQPHSKDQTNIALKSILAEVSYSKEMISLHFQRLPWPVEIPITQNGNLAKPPKTAIF